MDIWCLNSCRGMARSAAHFRCEALLKRCAHHYFVLGNYFQEGRFSLFPARRPFGCHVAYVAQIPGHLWSFPSDNESKDMSQRDVSESKDMSLTAKTCLCSLSRHVSKRCLWQQRHVSKTCLWQQRHVFAPFQEMSQRDVSESKDMSLRPKITLKIAAGWKLTYQTKCPKSAILGWFLMESLIHTHCIYASHVFYSWVMSSIHESCLLSMSRVFYSSVMSSIWLTLLISYHPLNIPGLTWRHGVVIMYASHVFYLWAMSVFYLWVMSHR
jgi:hypothetical protein